MKEVTARKILRLARLASARLNEAIKVIQEKESTAVFKHYRSGVGRAMGEVYFAIIDPVLMEHPKLTPPGLRPTDVSPPDKLRSRRKVKTR